MFIEKYQLQVIRRKRITPKPGDVFVVNPKEEIYFYGVVVDKFQCPGVDDECYVAFIFKDRARDITDTMVKFDFEKILIRPVIIDKTCWTRGYFLM